MRTNRSEHIANVSLAQAARLASTPATRREVHKARMARVAAACAPGGSVGPWLRFAGYAVVVTLAAAYGSAAP